MKKKFNTKFPLARIKKIMRMDEEVGKVAVSTPILISKSLELFLASIVEETCKETRARGSTKLSAAHLKKCINTNERFDFLKDVVANVPDLEMEEAEPKKGRRGKGTAVSSSTKSGGKGRGKGRSKDISEDAVDAPSSLETNPSEEVKNTLLSE